MFGKQRGHDRIENYEVEENGSTRTPFLTLPSGPLYLAYAAITGNHTSIRQITIKSSYSSAISKIQLF